MSFDWSARTRRERYAFELLTLDLKRVGQLERVRSCQLDWSIDATYRGSGNLSVTAPTPLEWQRYLIRPWLVVENATGRENVPLGTYLAVLPEQKLHSGQYDCTLELHDRTMILDEWKLDATYTVAAGTRVDEALLGVMERLSLVGFSVTPAAQTLPAAMVWDPSADDVSWLRVINDLGRVAGFAGVYPDARGVFRMEPYVAPGDRPVEWRLADDGASQRYVPGVTIRTDADGQYNSWVFWSRPDGDSPPLMAKAVNDDPDHPFSTVALGRQRTDRRTDVEVASVTELQALVNQAKAETMANQRTFELQARFIPATEHQVVELVAGSGAVTARASVSGRSLECSPGSTLRLNLREVSR